MELGDILLTASILMVIIVAVGAFTDKGNNRRY
jgi:hypothetical protein